MQTSQHVTTGLQVETGTHVCNCLNNDCVDACTCGMSAHALQLMCYLDTYCYISCPKLVSKPSMAWHCVPQLTTKLCWENQHASSHHWS